MAVEIEIQEVDPDLQILARKGPLNFDTQIVVRWVSSQVQSFGQTPSLDHNRITNKRDDFKAS